MQRLNQYIGNINRIEFTVTHSCTSKCRHCSVGNQKGASRLSHQKVQEVVRKIAQTNQVESVMTFGGEPLLVPEVTCAIHEEALQCGIPTRQIITNGCFSNKDERIREVAHKLVLSGVNDILLSVDCFHQEFLSLAQVRKFVEALQTEYTGRLRLHPSWVVNDSDDNQYNVRTRECLAYFEDLHVEGSRGNIIFPAGNAVQNLAEYFKKQPMDSNFRCGQAPYTVELDKVNEIIIDPNGDVFTCSFSIGNIMERDILEIIRDYDPYANPYTKALISGGIDQLIAEAKLRGVEVDASQFYTPCEICHTIAQKVNN